MLLRKPCVNDEETVAMAMKEEMLPIIVGAMSTNELLVTCDCDSLLHEASVRMVGMGCDSTFSIMLCKIL